MNVKRRSTLQTGGAYPGFLIMKQAEEYWYSPLDGMPILRRVTPPPPSSMSLVQLSLS